MIASNICEGLVCDEARINFLVPYLFVFVGSIQCLLVQYIQNDIFAGDAEGEGGAGPGFAKGMGSANGAGYEYRFAFSPSPVTDNQGTQHLRLEPPKPFAFRRSRA